jgi:hypothetical protein
MHDPIVDHIHIGALRIQPERRVTLGYAMVEMSPSSK